MTDVVPLDFETAEGEIQSYEPAVNADVDELFYREWVRALLERSVADLKSHAEGVGRPIMFEVFSRYDLIEDTETRPTYTEIGWLRDGEISGRGQKRHGMKPIIPHDER